MYIYSEVYSDLRKQKTAGYVSEFFELFNEYFQRLSALWLLLIFSPVLGVVALCIRWESKGNYIFTQTRIGKNGKPFTIYKFRSMYLKTDYRYTEPGTESNREGICKKLYNDPRITQVGRIIRKLSIDELPQLWNVVVGDMLLVGPRPALPREVSEYPSQALGRLAVMPGITGLWQVSGRADTSFEEQIALDLRYVRERSLYTDLKILLLTIPAVISGKGAY